MSTVLLKYISVMDGGTAHVYKCIAMSTLGVVYKRTGKESSRFQTFFGYRPHGVLPAADGRAGLLAEADGEDEPNPSGTRSWSTWTTRVSDGIARLRLSVATSEHELWDRWLDAGAFVRP